MGEDAKLLLLLDELRTQHPKETADQLFQRFIAKVKEDDGLKEAMLRSSFNSLVDEVRADAEKRGVSAPGGLQKPN